MTHPFALTVRAATAPHIYLEAAAGVTTFLLAGRYLEARAKRRAGAALRALLELGRQGRSPCCATARETRIPVDRLAVGDEFVVRPGREGRHRRRGRGRRLRARREPAHRRVGAGRGRPGRPGDRRHGQRRRPAAWSGPPGSAPTPSSPRWPGWSRRRRTARPPCSGWPTGSPAVFVPVVLALAVGDARLLARRRRRRDGRVHRRGGRADHRLPVRPRPGHARPRCWSAPAGAPSSAS